MKKSTYLKRGIMALALAVSTLQLHAKLTPVTEWVRHGGGAGWNASTAITTDPWGNVYYTGAFEGAANFNLSGTGANFTAAGTRDIFIAKRDASGHFAWAKHIGVKGTNQGMAIQTDALGNVYVAGQFNGSPDFNPGTGIDTLAASGSTDAFVLKLDSAGNFLWAKNIGSTIIISRSGQIIAYGMAVDSANVYVTGEADRNVFITKLDFSGNFIWTKTMGGNGNDYCYAITTDDSGNVYTTGSFDSVADFNPDPNIAFNITPTGNRQVFISKLNASGDFVWAKSFVGDISNNPPNRTFAWSYGIKIDMSGNIYTTGYFRGTMDFDPATNTAHKLTSALSDLFISKLDANGNFIWAKNMSGTVIDGNALAVDNQGSPYVIGWYNSSADFDPGTGPADTFKVTSAGSNDIFIIKLDSSGTFAWAKSYGGAKSDYGYAIATDTNLNVYATGYFSDTVNFDTSLNDANFISFGNYDIFTLKINQVCLDTSSSYHKVTLCEDQYSFNGTTYEKSGVYTDVFTTASGCDSIVTLNLTLNGKIQHPYITVKVFELSTTGTYNSYQWLLNGNIIPGATDSTYTVMQNGNYNVIVSNAKGCKDTSDLYQVTNYTGIEDIPVLAHQIRIYPNPAQDFIQIDAPVPINVTLTSIDGKVIKHQEINAAANKLSVKELATGMYLISITDKNGHLIKVEKLIHN